MSKQFLLHSEPRGSRQGFMRRDEGVFEGTPFFVTVQLRERTVLLSR